MQNRSIRTLGIRLREAREKRGFSQEGAAEALGTTQSTMSKWERNAQDPGTGKLAEMARLYGVSVDWLLTEHEDIIHHGRSGRERSVKIVMSSQSLVIAVVQGSLSEEAITELCEFTDFICRQDGRRRGRKARSMVRRERRKSAVR